MWFNSKHEASPGWRFVETSAAIDHSIHAPASLDSLRAAGTGRTARLDRLIEAGAWTDAALALAKLELPGWQLRRLVYDGGEWLCSLSRQPNLPGELDDTADGCHATPALAIWSAVLEARRRIDEGSRTGSVPSIRPMSGHPVCCDNFA